MKKYIFAILSIFIMVGGAGAGYNDRFSPVRLERDGTIYIPNAQREIPLPITAFTGNDTRETVATINGIRVINGGPFPAGKFYFDIDPASPALTWAAGTPTSKATTTFKIPENFDSEVAGPKFTGYDFGFYLDIVQQRTTGTTSPAAIDFEVFVNRDNQAPDLEATDQDAVSLLASRIGKHEILTLTPISDGKTVRAGDVVTFRFWPVNNGSTHNIRFHGGAAYYFPKY